MSRTGIKLLALAALLGYSGFTLAQNTPPDSPANNSKKQAFRQLLQKQFAKQKQAEPAAPAMENPVAMPGKAAGLPGIAPPAKGLPAQPFNPANMTAEQRQAMQDRFKEMNAKMPRPTDSQLQGIVKSSQVIEKKRDAGSESLPRVAPQAPSAVSRAIDEQLSQELAPMLKAAAPADKTTSVSITTTKCDDATYLRRVYLDLVGRSPRPRNLRRSPLILPRANARRLWSVYSRNRSTARTGHVTGAMW